MTCGCIGFVPDMPPRFVSLASERESLASALKRDFHIGQGSRIKAFRNGQLLQLKVDLLAGEILPNPAPRTQKPLSAIVKGLEDQGYGPILDVERDGGDSEPRSAWDVEAFKGSSEVNVSVDPVSGKITTK